MASPCDDFNATPFPGQMMDFPSTPTSSQFQDSFCPDFGNPVTSTPNRWGAAPWSDECPSTPTTGFDDQTFDLSGSLDSFQNDCDMTPFPGQFESNQTACNDSFFGDFSENNTQMQMGDPTWDMDFPAGATSTPNQCGNQGWDMDFPGGATSTPNRGSQGGVFDSSFNSPFGGFGESPIGFGSNPFDCEDFSASTNMDDFNSEFEGQSTLNAFAQADLYYGDESQPNTNEGWNDMAWFGDENAATDRCPESFLPMAPDSESEWKDQVTYAEARGWEKPILNPFSEPSAMSQSLSDCLSVPATRVHTIPGIEEFRSRMNECDQTITNVNDESSYFSCDDDTMTPDDTMYHSFDDSYGDSDYETCPEYD